MAKELTKSQKVRNYFLPFPMYAVVLIIIGVPLLFVYGAGVLVIALGIFILVNDPKKRPSEKEMDDWLEQDLVFLNKKCLEKTGIDASELKSETVQVIGIRLWDVAGELLSNVVYDIPSPESSRLIFSDTILEYLTVQHRRNQPMAA